MDSANDQNREREIVAQLTEIQLPLLLYVRSLLPGDSAARDVAQQTNAKIWEKRADFEPGTNFRAWAFSIARFEVLNFRKQQARDTRLTFSEELEHTIATELAEDSSDIQQRHEVLQRCLRKLRSGDRDLLLHRYSTAGTLAEFAETAGRSAGGLKVTLHRLRNSLLECMRLQFAQQETSS